MIVANNKSIKEKTIELIDALKSTCQTYGMGNDGNEYKIITQVFLYKFINDKFLIMAFYYSNIFFSAFKFKYIIKIAFVLVLLFFFLFGQIYVVVYVLHVVKVFERSDKSLEFSKLVTL